MEYKLLTKEQLQDNFLRKGVVLNVVDGDTLDLYIKNGFTQGLEERVRLNRLDTPEKFSTEAPAGHWVKDKVIDWLEGESFVWLHSVSFDTDRYGRCLADIYKNDGSNLNQWLLSMGYAWPADANGRVLGPRDIQRLNIPSGIKEQVLINQRM